MALSSLDSSKKQPPVGTLPYTVTESDTLASIAAQCNMTISELKFMNRLMTSTIFPGQVLFVKPKTAPDEDTGGQRSSTGSFAEGVRPNSSSSVGSGSSLTDRERHPSNASRHEEQSDLGRVRDMFHKVSSTKYITDGMGIVGGSLLVTITSVMFDPDKSDQLVKELGIDNFTVAVPVDNVIQMAIYDDIAAMGNTGAYCSQVYRGPKPSPENADIVTVSSDSSLSAACDSAARLDSSNSAPDVTADKLSNGATSTTDGVVAEVTNVTSSDTSQSSSDVVVVSDQSNTALDSCDGPEVAKCNQAGNSSPVDIPESTVSRNGTTNERRNGSATAAVAAHLPTVGSPCQFAVDDIASSPLNLKAIPENAALQSEDFSPGSAAVVTCGSLNKASADDANHPGVFGMSPSNTRLGRLGTLNLASSMSRFTSTGSFIVPENEDVFVDLSCGFFSVEPEDIGRVKDVSMLHMPSPSSFAPVARFQVGDDEAADPIGTGADAVKYSPQRKVDTAGTSHFVVTTTVPGATKSGRKDQQPTATEMKIEMIDATPRDVVNEIFNRTEELIIKPATRFTDLPKYLCVRIGWQVNGKLPVMNNPMDSDVNPSLQAEYWFSIPSGQVASLYSFIHRRLPTGIYGSDDEIDPTHRNFERLTLDELRAKIECAYRETNEGKTVGVANAQLELLPPPELSEPSVILNLGHMHQLRKHLLPITEGCMWVLRYCTDKHGYSLTTLYNRVKDVTSPVLLVVKDDGGAVFGAMVPVTLKVNPGFYGSGSMYVFTFSPHFKKFNWTGENDYFIQGHAEYLSFGAGRGVSGLWIDGALNHGRSETCATFRNDPLASRVDFLIRQVEVWSFAT